jgi:hypothetical protein
MGRKRRLGKRQIGIPSGWSGTRKLVLAEQSTWTRSRHVGQVSEAGVAPDCSREVLQGNLRTVIAHYRRSETVQNCEITTRSLKTKVCSRGAILQNAIISASARSGDACPRFLASSLLSISVLPAGVAR